MYTYTTGKKWRKFLITEQNKKETKKSAERDTYGEYSLLIFMVTPCINDIKHFNVQLLHTTLRT
jgi:hypothetical protein